MHSSLTGAASYCGLEAQDMQPDSDVLVSGFEGYPCYRIPALLRLPGPGLVLLFAEGRRGGDRGPNDIVHIRRRRRRGGSE